MNRKTLDELMAEQSANRANRPAHKPEAIRDFADLMLEEEEKALAIGRAEIAKHDAEWNALPQAERDRINAEREARFESLSATEDEPEFGTCCQCGVELHGDEGNDEDECDDCHAEGDE